MANDEREALIEKAAEALAKAEGIRSWSVMSRTDQKRYGEYAAAVIAVFEQACTPTDDEMWRKRCAEETIAWADATKRADIAEERWRAAEDECRAVQSRLDALLAEQAHTPSDDERPTIELARFIASWDQGVEATNRIPHWAANLAMHLRELGFRRTPQGEPADDEREVRDFYEKHYSDSGWSVEQVDVRVFVPTTRPGNALEIIQQALDSAGLDIRAVPAGFRRPVIARHADGGALAKVYDALHGAGYRRADIEDIVKAMQNAGIAFRERRPVQAEPTEAMVRLRRADGTPKTNDEIRTEAAALRDALKTGENRG